MADYSLHSDRESKPKYGVAERYMDHAGAGWGKAVEPTPASREYTDDVEEPRPELSLSEQIFEAVECMIFLSFRDKHEVLKELEKVLERNGY